MKLGALVALSLAACAAGTPSAPDGAGGDDGDDTATAILKVTLEGDGGGSVSSSPAGIDCAPACTMSVAPGTSVTLTATPDADSVFSGWSGGGCTGTGTCTVAV